MVQSDIQISIITINYNGLANTCALIETIPFNDYPLEVIVVDNASSEDEATHIEQRYPKIKVIRSKKNLGFAGGNNLGIKAALGRYLFFINNDTILKPQTSDLKHLIGILALFSLRVTPHFHVSHYAIKLSVLVKRI